MDEISFEVQGSAPEPYLVTFVRRSPTNLSAYCSCPAGENGQYCKHRFAILDGAENSLVSSNASDIQIVQFGCPEQTLKQRYLESASLRRKQKKSRESCRLQNTLLPEPCVIINPAIKYTILI